jgi:hypothetical protein
MAPVSHTIFAVSLFFALIALWQWLERRRRASESARPVVDNMRATPRD